MTAHVYIASWCKNKSLGEFESLCEPKPQATVYINTFEFSQTLLSV